MINVKQSNSDEDLEHILRLAQELDNESAEQYNRMPYNITDSFRKDYFNDDHVFFIAFLDGRIAGYICARHTLDVEKTDLINSVDIPAGIKPDHYYINTIFISKNMRQKGIGKALMEAQINYAKKCGQKAVWSFIPKQKTSSVALHKSAGFEIIDFNNSHYKSYLELAV